MPIQRRLGYLQLARQRGGHNELTAEDHLQLGRYALQRAHPSLANIEFKLAERLDGSCRPRIEAARNEYRDRLKTIKLYEKKK